MSEFQNRMGGAAQAGTDGTPLERVLSQLMGGHRDEAGLSHLVDRLRGGGLGEQAESWISNGPNRHVDPEELEQAIGQEEADRLALSAGVPRSGLMSVLAMFLPQLVNHLTPSGHLPRSGIGTPPGSSAGGGVFGDLGGLLGGGIGTPPGDRPSSSGGGLGGLLGGLFGGLLGGGIGTPPADQAPRFPPSGGAGKGPSSGAYAPKSDPGGYPREADERSSGGGFGDILGGIFGRRDDPPEPRMRGGHTEEEIGSFWQDLTRGRGGR